MNKKTWWIIALALAVAFTLLAKNTEQGQTLVQEVVKYVKVAPAADTMSGDVASGTVEDVVATGATDTGAVVADAAVVATGTEVVADAEVVATGTAQ